MIYREKFGIGLSLGCLVYCQHAGQHGGVRFVSFSSQYRYESPHLILSNVPEVFVFFNDRRSRFIDHIDKISYCYTNIDNDYYV